MRRRLLLSILAAVVVLIAFLALQRVLRGGGEEAEPQPVVTAATAVARRDTFAVTIHALGTVAPRPGAAARLAAPAATRVSKIYVGVGDAVTAGQPLVALDESVWRAQTQQAQAQMEAARKAYDRASRLVNEGIAPRKEMESAFSDVARAQAELADAQRRQSLGVLRSPIAGVVTHLDVALESPVDANQPLVEVVNPTGLEVRFHLSPTQAGRVSVGAAVELSTGDDSAAFVLGRGRIEGISAAVDSATGSVAVRAVVTAPTRALRVNETVAGEIIVARHPGAIVVPAAAIVPEGGANEVYVVGADGIAHARPVTLGGRTASRVEVLTGLRAGEVVVTEGAYGVTDGSRVRPAVAADTNAAGGAEP